MNDAQIALGFMLQLHQDLIRMRFADLEHCAVSVEQLLNNEFERRDIQAKAKISAMSAEQRDFCGDDVDSDKLYQLKESFPQTIRISLFMHSYAVFEHSLYDLAMNLRKELNLDLAPKDLTGEGIIRSRTYLVRVAKLAFPDTSIWQQIVILSRMRNCFGHRDGCLSDDCKGSKEIKTLIKKMPNALKLHTEFDESKIEIISDEFVKYVLSTFSEFTKQLFATISSTTGVR